MKLNLKDRFKAFFIHLLLSAVILAVLLCLIFFIWFPQEMIFAGGILGLIILASVDLVLGPILTFMVFNRAKTSLKFDLSVIAAIQISAMIVGVLMIYSQRPIVQVIADDGLHLITQPDAEHYETDLSLKVFRKPPLKLLEIPELANIDGLKLSTEFVEGRPFSYRDDLYLNATDITQEIYDKRIELIYSRVSSTQKAELKQLLTHDNCDWVPLYSNHLGGYACINITQGIIKVSNKKAFYSAI